VVKRLAHPCLGLKLALRASKSFTLSRDGDACEARLGLQNCLALLCLCLLHFLISVFSVAELLFFSQSIEKEALSLFPLHLPLPPVLSGPGAQLICSGLVDGQIASLAAGHACAWSDGTWKSGQMSRARMVRFSTLLGQRSAILRAVSPDTEKSKP
jgi:hypothetical protein